MHQFLEETVEEEWFFPREPRAATDRQANGGDAYFTKLWKRSLRWGWFAPQARVQRIDEQCVDVPLLQNTEDVVQRAACIARDYFGGRHAS